MLAGQIAKKPCQCGATGKRELMRRLGGLALREDIKASGHLGLAKAMGVTINLANYVGGNESGLGACCHVFDEGNAEIQIVYRRKLHEGVQNILT
jgi:hypothetical protein